MSTGLTFKWTTELCIYANNGWPGGEQTHQTYIKMNSEFTYM